FAIVQAEDELAAIGMVLGAGWAGARSMTATSGPGISLMTEFTGMGYYAELPGVIFDIQRVGPSTGLPTRTSQGDVLTIAFLGHGDTKNVMLFPGSVTECFTMATEAFDLAEQLQTPVFVLSDLDLGMNNWMSDPFPYPEKPIQRGKVLSAEDLTRLGGFARYKDVDNDGIPYRTLPGTEHPAAAYFTRGSGHNEKAQYGERPEDYQNNMERLARKFETARSYVPRPEVLLTPDAEIGIVAYGSSDFAVHESLEQLKSEYRLDASYLRIRGFPFNREVHEFVDKHKRIYVVEQNRDAQMLSLLKLDLKPSQTGKLRSVRHFNGLPIDARSVTDDIISQEGKWSMATTPPSTSTPVPPKPNPKINRLGLQVVDYRGGKTTLCAGCGHNAISERVIDAMYEMGVQPERVLKLSGIGCSSKTPAYFIGRAHSF